MYKHTFRIAYTLVNTHAYIHTHNNAYVSPAIHTYTFVNNYIHTCTDRYHAFTHTYIVKVLPI